MPIGKSVAATLGTSADDPKSLADVSDEGAASTLAGEAVAASGAKFPNVGRFRWVMCALLFFATTINYVDRQVLGIIAPGIQNGPTLWTPEMISDALEVVGALRAPTTPAARHSGEIITSNPRGALQHRCCDGSLGFNC